MRGRARLRQAPPGEARRQEAAAPEEERPGPSGGAAMLPWKRRTFEVAGAGAAAGAACSAEGALGRVGQLLGGVGGVGRRRRRQTFRVSREAPSHRVLYLGNAPTLQAKGEGCTDAAVGRIWAKSQAGRLGARMRLSLGPQGLRLAPPDGDPRDPEARGPAAHLYLLHRVTYCAADARLPRLFAWVYRHEGKHKAVVLRCHAALLAKARKARALALRLAHAAAAALADFRRLKRRADARRRHPQLLLPARPPPARQPPVERSRSAPKLGAIAEDPRGEAREEQRERRRRHSALAALASGLGRLAIGADSSGSQDSLHAGDTG